MRACPRQSFRHSGVAGPSSLEANHFPARRKVICHVRLVALAESVEIWPEIQGFGKANFRHERCICKLGPGSTKTQDNCNARYETPGSIHVVGVSERSLLFRSAQPFVPGRFLQGPKTRINIPD